jgi:riboflavin kinase/FMN adenylyltransferase
LLGREFTIEGPVMHGHRRGKQLGFPTANIKPEPKLHPPEGVYAGYCRVRGKMHPAVMNIGRNPTFKVRRVSYEAHILDFDQDIYGETIKVYLVDRLRGEMTFNGPDALKAQIQKDVERGRGMLTLLPQTP